MKNDKLESDLINQKEETERMTNEKNRSKVEIGQYKKDLDTVNDEWETKKKELEHSINLLSDSNREATEEYRKEQTVFEQIKNKYRLQNDKICNEMNGYADKIKSYKNTIGTLKAREAYSLQAVQREVEQFRKLLAKTITTQDSLKTISTPN